MNKEKIVEELNEYVKGLDHKFSVKNDNDHLELLYSGEYQACFLGFNHKYFTFHISSDLGALFIKEGYLTKFYNKAIELMDKYGAKYTVQVIKHDDYSYVNFDTFSKVVCFESALGEAHIKTEFTQSEIEELKKRDDVAINWDKAIIKEVTD